MLKYIIKRLLLFIPTLIVISFLAFGLSKCTPGDPVPPPGEDDHTERSYRQAAKQLGLDKPAFYFNFTSAAYPDTLYRIVHKYEREAVSKLIGQYGNWPAIEKYANQINKLKILLGELPDTIGAISKAKVLPELKLMEVNFAEKSIAAKFKRIDRNIKKDSTLHGTNIVEEIEQLNLLYQNIKEQPTRNRLYLPAFYWYGFDNQYHHWLTRFLKGDFGVSEVNGQSVADIIWKALRWTLLINGVAILVAYLFSIPIGVYVATHQGKPIDRITSVILFMLHSLPSFWVATLAIVFLTTPEYGMDWFPTLGLGNYAEGTPFWERFWGRAWHMVLPVFCLSYGSLAFISRQMRGAMVDVLRQDFIRTAKAKGLSSKIVVWKHGFRNALFPIITMFASILPASIAGSVVIEVIFNIHGMGKVMIDSIGNKDWTVVYAILMLASILTMLGILIADIMYAAIDPRVRLGKK